jgi:hypothetical protein
MYNSAKTVKRWEVSLEAASRQGECNKSIVCMGYRHLVATAFQGYRGATLLHHTEVAGNV